VRGLAYQQLGRYAEALADLTCCHRIVPRLSKAMGFDHVRAFLHGLRGETEAARTAVCDQLGLTAAPGPGDALARFLHERLRSLLANLDLRGSVGVFFGSYGNALGHAVLDPFNVVNLFGPRFDNLIMVHPDLGGWPAATRLTVGILDQYVDTVPCGDADVLNFAWQHLGELRHENLTFLVHNYWALNRLAFHARRDEAHPLRRERTYSRPTQKIAARAEALCGRNGIDLSRPIVVLHTREHGYHELRGQSYRNMDARHYAPALRRLLALGYQVVRAGDRGMTCLRGDVPGLIELPFVEHYSPVLDPYLIARSEFMISCQSGPCSYARVFGRPNLVVNAVYHYTLLPEQRELIAFKDYRDRATGRRLGVEEIFRAGAHLFDRTSHFAEHGIEVEDMTAEEIDAAVCEMLDWLPDPHRPETAAQTEFRRLMEQFGKAGVPGSRLAGPMTDYVGYALPECRLSEAVAALRPGYLSAGSKRAARAA
jgi:putative glycosyltransferase (TIGR04372 family)